MSKGFTGFPSSDWPLIIEMSDEEREYFWPNLKKGTFEKTSECKEYNCVAFILEDEENWWDDYFGKWPEDIPRQICSIENYEKFFNKHGFQRCDSFNLEDGFLKIALYGNTRREFLHVAIQQKDGTWKSKMGGLEDIRHSNLTLLSGAFYGTPLLYMKRKVNK